MNNKKELWRIILGILSIVFTIFMWIKKDIVTIYSTMPKEQVFSMIATTIAVSLVKVLLISALILLVKWIIGKIGRKEKP